MVVKRQRFVNVYFNRYLEQAISNIGTDFLPSLDATDRANIIAKRTFIKEASLEQKLLLLAKLGHPYVLLIGDKSKVGGMKTIIRLIRIFINKKFFDKKQAVKEMKDAGAYAATDVDIVKAMMLAANIYNTPMYNLVNSYKDITDKIFVHQTEAMKLAGEINAAYEIDAIINKGIMAGCNRRTSAEFQALYKMSGIEFVVLSYLSRKRQARLEDVRKFIGHSAGNILGRMRRQGIVTMRNQTDQVNEYWISGHGEVVLIEARKFFIKHMQ